MSAGPLLSNHLQVGHGAQHCRHGLLADVEVAAEAQAAHEGQGPPPQQHFISDRKGQLHLQLVKGGAGGQLAGGLGRQLDAWQAEGRGNGWGG